MRRYFLIGIGELVVGTLYSVVCALASPIPGNRRERVIRPSTSYRNVTVSSKGFLDACIGPGLQSSAGYPSGRRL